MFNLAVLSAATDMNVSVFGWVVGWAAVIICPERVAFLLLYIIVHGMAQHNGKQTGTTAAPDLLELFDLLSASYSYLPLPLAQPP